MALLLLLLVLDVSEFNIVNFANFGHLWLYFIVLDISLLQEHSLGVRFMWFDYNVAIVDLL